MSFSNWVHIEAEIVQETEAAFLVRIDEEEMWLPKSQIADPDDYQVGDIGTVSISEWIAKEKGLDYEV